MGGKRKERSEGIFPNTSLPLTVAKYVIKKYGHYFPSNVTGALVDGLLLGHTAPGPGRHLLRV